MELEKIKQALEPDIVSLLNHPLYSWVNDRNRLQRFMTWHVYCVWDFMSLAKRLQHDLSSTSLPWLPPQHPQLVRFIHEVVLGEECDVGPDGTVLSHFDLYLQAMEEVGAGTDSIHLFIDRLKRGQDLEQAFLAAKTPQPVANFVRESIQLALEGEILEVATAFYFGREDLIPEMFQRLLECWQPSQFESFRYYLQRHIELDGDEHGPLAERLLSELSAGEDQAEQRVLYAGRAAIAQRGRLWDAICN